MSRSHCSPRNWSPAADRPCQLYGDQPADRLDLLRGSKRDRARRAAGFYGWPIASRAICRVRAIERRGVPVRLTPDSWLPASLRPCMEAMPQAVKDLIHSNTEVVNLGPDYVMHGRSRGTASLTAVTGVTPVSDARRCSSTHVAAELVYQAAVVDALSRKGAGMPRMSS
jgi:hypothetical protein